MCPRRDRGQGQPRGEGAADGVWSADRLVGESGLRLHPRVSEESVLFAPKRRSRNNSEQS